MTSIRDSLTYPHYSKEIIQAILYCKTGGQVSPSTLRVFRNSLLGLQLASPQKLQSEFDRTDVFVIEIASLLEYKKSSDFYHHIAVEIESDVEIRRQTLDELREDVLTIRDLLAPKQVLISTHYATSEVGLRAELIRNLKVIGKSAGIPTLDPSEMNKVWPPNTLHQPENVISHFSTKGHEIMAARYKDRILNLTSYSTKTPLVQMYKPGLVLNDYHGLGDFIYGSLRLHQEAESRGRPAKIDISHHPMSKFLCSKYESDSSVRLPIVKEEDSHLFEEGGVVFTHLRPVGRVSVADIDFVLRNAFEPNTEFKLQLGAYKKSLNLSGTPYSIVHFRFGDQYINQRGDEYFESFQVERIQEFIETLSRERRILIASDAEFFLKEMASRGYGVLAGEVAHTGMEMQTESALRDTLLQFFTLKDSAEIVQVSNYSWGSGFSKTASILGQVPLRKLHMSELN